VKSHHRREYGFTLLEILVTLFVFGIIASTLFIAYRALFINTGQFEETARRHAQAQVCVHRILSDLKAIKIATVPFYAPPREQEPADPFRLVGQTAVAGDTEFASLRFTSLAHLSLDRHPRAGIAEIRYYVEESADHTFVLRRSDRLYNHRKPASGSPDPILCEEVKSIRFTYYDTAGESHEHWDSDSADYAYAMPAAIVLELEIGNDISTALFRARIALPVRREARATL
jgi:general secretion pathway protein J